MVFLKLEVSAVLADSPIRRCRGVKETSELRGGGAGGGELDDSAWGFVESGMGLTEWPSWRPRWRSH